MGRPYEYVDLLGQGGELQKPFESGGNGLHFVYLSNRNHCTYLYEPREVDRSFVELLDRHFPMGYSTLSIVEKWWSSGSKSSTPDRRAGSKVPGRVRDAEGYRYGALRSPEHTAVGSGAILAKFDSIQEAIRAAEDYRAEQRVPVLAGRLVDELSWH